MCGISFEQKQPRHKHCSKGCSRRANWRKIKGNPRTRIDNNMRKAIGAALNGSKNGRSWTTLAGYSLGDLVAHLEARFAKGMTLGNYGEWEVDHVRARSKYRYSKPEQRAFGRCWALQNLAPRWRTTAIAMKHGSTQLGNIEKGAKTIAEAQPVLI